MADTEFDKNALVSLGIITFQVGEEPTPLGNHGEQSPTGRMVFFVGFEMRFQLGETPAEDCDLHFGGAGIGRVNLIFRDDLPLDIDC